MNSVTETVQLPSGNSTQLRAFTTRILRIERESQTVIHGSGGGGKIREKRPLFSNRYEVRGDIKPIEIGSHTEHKQRIWYQDGGRQTYFEVFDSHASGLEGHELVLVLKDETSVVAAYNIDANETIIWGPFVVPPSTVGSVLKRAGIAVVIVGILLAFMMKETVWNWVMLFAIGVACVWTFFKIKEIEHAKEDDKALEEATIPLITEVTGGRVGRTPEVTPVYSPAETARLR